MSKSGSVNLFAYGILRSRDVLSRTIGRQFDGTMVPAVLPGYQLLDTSPRYIIPDQSKGVEGVLILGLTQDDLWPLDRLEGTRWGHYIRNQGRAYMSRADLITVNGSLVPLGFPRTDDGAIEIDKLRAVDCHFYVAGLSGCYGIIRSTLANLESRIQGMEASK